MNSETHKTLQQARSLVADKLEEASEKIHDAVETVQEKGKEIIEQAQTQGQQIAEQIEQGSEYLKSRDAAALSHDLHQWTREHVGFSLVSALGVGILIGAALVSRR